jgi:predicted aspartyl protease
MGRFAVEVNLANHEDAILVKAGSLEPDQVRRVRVSGTVDPGASHLVVPKSVATQLGLSSAGKATVHYADRRKAIRDVVKDVDVELLQREGTFKAIVEPRRTDVLIGAIVLEDLDLLVDCTSQTLQPRDPHRIVAELE